LGKYAKRVGDRVIANQRKKWLVALFVVLFLIIAAAVLFGGVSWLLH